jgi:hypothetical protein
MKRNSILPDDLAVPTEICRTLSTGKVCTSLVPLNLVTTTSLGAFLCRSGNRRFCSRFIFARFSLGFFGFPRRFGECSNG